MYGSESAWTLRASGIRNIVCMKYLMDNFSEIDVNVTVPRSQSTDTHFYSFTFASAHTHARVRHRLTHASQGEMIIRKMRRATTFDSNTYFALHGCECAAELFSDVISLLFVTLGCRCFFWYIYFILFGVGSKATSEYLSWRWCIHDDRTAVWILKSNVAIPYNALDNNRIYNR